MRMIGLMFLVFVIWGGPDQVRADQSYENRVKQEMDILAQVIQACVPEGRKACAYGFIEACSARGKWTTVAMVLCNGVAHDHWDREMNRVYRDLMKRARGELRTSIRDAQRSWIAYRDDRCGIYRHFEGSMWRPVAVSCRAETTFARLRDLDGIRDSGPIAAASASDDPAITWRTAQSLALDMNCDGVVDKVVFGVDSRPNIRRGAVGWIDGREADAPTRLVVSVPIDDETQFALCHDSVTLEKSAKNAGACPVLRVDDGRCDTLYLWRDTTADKWVLDRN